jgi:hypothetical protein
MWSKDSKGLINTDSSFNILQLKESIETLYTPNMETVYRKVIMFIIDNLFQGFGGSGDKQKTITA